MEKTETGYRLDRQRRGQRMGRMFAVEQAGIAKKMNMNEGKEQEQADAATKLFSQTVGHPGN